MAQKDARDVIYNGDVVLIDDEVVNSIAISCLWLTNVLWVDPFALYLYRVLVSKFKTSNLAQFSFRILVFEFQKALDFSWAI